MSWMQKLYETYENIQKNKGNFIGESLPTPPAHIEQQAHIEITLDKDGNFKPATLRMSFKNPMINKKICTYMKALELRENIINSKDDYSEEEFNVSLQRINENIEEIKQHLLDDSMVVKKGTDRLTVKVYQN